MLREIRAGSTPAKGRLFGEERVSPPVQVSRMVQDRGVGLGQGRQMIDSDAAPSNDFLVQSLCTLRGHIVVEGGVGAHLPPGWCVCVGGGT